MKWVVINASHLTYSPDVINPSEMFIPRRLLRSFYVPYQHCFNFFTSIHLFSKGCFILTGLLCAVALYYRTTNIWTLKNMGDAFLSRKSPFRPIIFGAFHRNHMEQNIPGNYVVIFTVKIKYNLCLLACCIH